MNDINNSLKNLGINRINSLINNSPIGAISKTMIKITKMWKMSNISLFWFS